MSSINYPVGAGVTNEVDPISRIEGHLGIGVNVSGGKVIDAYAHGNLWRGFENFLLQRTANDAITFVQRICGVCPVPHGMTSTHAVDTVLGYSKGHITFAYDGSNGIPAKAILIRNLVLGVEFLMSSITHFYHLAAPSYVQGPNIPPWTPYFDNSFYHPLLLSGGAVLPTRGADGFYSANLWSTVIRSYVVALRIRRLTFEAGALFAGRMPMTSVLVGGGVTYDGTEDISARCATFTTITQEVGRFIIQEYVPIALALGALYPNYDNKPNADLLYSVPFGANPHGLWEVAHADNVGVAPSTSNTGYGAGLGRFLAWGAFPDTTATGGLTLPGGVSVANKTTLAGSDYSATPFTVINKADVYNKFLTGTTSVPNNLTEDISHSRYGIDSRDSAAYALHSNNAAYPGSVSRTKPLRSKGYTYMKAPRWGGASMEVGPMARMYVSGKFVNGTALADPSSLGSAYTAYVKTVGATTGLDPRMVQPDIAVALLRAGLATLTNGATVYDNVNTAAASTTTLTTVYSNASTVITGTIAAWVINLKAGLSTIDRLRARALESLVLVQAILGAYDVTKGSWVTSGTGANISGVYGDGVGSWAGGWIGELALTTPAAGSTWRNLSIPTTGAQGWGACEAPRGALMHQMEIDTAGRITKYQCIVPTTWNGSPIDANNNHGAIEAATIGNPFDTTSYSFTGQAGSVNYVGGVEVLRAAQSFDPCIACAIH